MARKNKESRQKKKRDACVINEADGINANFILDCLSFCWNTFLKHTLSVCVMCELIVGEKHNREIEFNFLFIFHHNSKKLRKPHSVNRMHSLQFSRILWTNAAALFQYVVAFSSLDFHVISIVALNLYRKQVNWLLNLYVCELCRIGIVYGNNLPIN